MFEKSDQKFERALKSPEEFGKLLKQLRLGRKIFTIYVALSFFGFLMVLVATLPIAREFPPGVHSLIMFQPLMLLYFPLIFLVKAYSLHAQIRTLLVFNALRNRDAPHSAEKSRLSF